MIKFIQFLDQAIMIFDDGKIFYTDEKLTNLNDNITEKNLSDYSDVFLHESKSADFIHQLESNRLALLYYKEEDKKFSVQIKIIQVDFRNK